VIDPNEANADWVSPSTSKYVGLPDQVADNPVNLLDHGFGENLRLGTNLDVRDRAARDNETSFHNGHCSRYELSEGAVTASTFLTDGLVLEIYDAIMIGDTVPEFGRFSELTKVLVELDSNKIAEVGSAVQISSTPEQRLERVQ